MTATARMAAVAAWLVLSPAVMACGFHGNVAVGALNAAYPNALWVRTAVWQAQIEGLLEHTDANPPASPVAERLALARRYRDVSGQLAQLRDHLAMQQSLAKTPPFSVLLMGPMLWSRFETHGDAVTLQVHTDGPVSGDVVLITDEPVLAALATGRMRMAQAVELGVVRVYGPPSARTGVSSVLEGWRPPLIPSTPSKRRAS